MARVSLSLSLSLSLCLLALGPACDPDSGPWKDDEYAFNSLVMDAYGGGPDACQENEGGAEGEAGQIVTNVALHGDGWVPDQLQLDWSNGDIGSPRSSGVITADAGGVDGDWGIADVPNVDCSYPSCGYGNWLMTVWENPGASTWTDQCDGFENISMQLTTADTDASSYVPSESECSSGSGTFQLIPEYVKDLNNNLYSRVAYKPAQVSGTGVLTNKANITQVVLVDDSGYPLRVLKADATATFTSFDAMVTPNNVSYAITGTHNFSDGQVVGVPTFFHPPVADGTTIDAQVSLTWNCGRTPTATTSSNGYQFRTSDIGCSGIQKVTMRPVSGGILWEQYGTREHIVRTSTDQNGNFHIARNGFVADGRLVAYDSDTATVQLVSATFNGLATCTPGTYTFARE